MKFSYHSLIFLFAIIPCLMIAYEFVPKQLRKYIILLFNYIFLLMWSKKAIIIQICLMFSTFFIGLKVDKFVHIGKDKEYKRKVKLYLWLGILLNLGILAVFKYLNFFMTIGADALALQFKPVQLLIPVGISYYTLQHISYLIDISSKKIKAENNFVHFAVYASFFATILQGPITRYDEVRNDITQLDSIRRENAVYGYQRIIWGLLKKVVIADRLAPAVNYLFDLHTTEGILVILVALLCTLQLYMDFSGTVDISIGVAEIFGIHLPENFKQPFFAKNATDFWHRWHLTLSRYLRDYVFYPISLSKSIMRLSKWFRKHNCKLLAKVVGPFIALFIVWLCNGLWHGANILFILYGMYYFLLMVFEIILEKPWKCILKSLNLRESSKSIAIFRFIKLLVIVCYGEMMCRVATLEELIMMTKSIFTNFNINQLISYLPSMPIFLSDWIIVIVGIAIIFIVSLCAENKIDLQQKFDRLATWERWTILYLFIFIVILFGAYGPGFDKIAMIYAGF